MINGRAPHSIRLQHEQVHGVQYNQQPSFEDKGLATTTATNETRAKYATTHEEHHVSYILTLQPHLSNLEVCIQVAKDDTTPPLLYSSICG